MRHAFIGLMAILTTGLVVAGLAAQAGGEDDLEYRWEGSVNVTQHGPVLGGEGQITTQWNLTVRWREAARFDVRDEQDRVVGQIVLLEDDDSSWTGSRGGSVENVGSCNRCTATYTGSGSGTSTLGTGWIYFSLVDANPLEADLPSGAYHLQAPRQQMLEGVMDYQSVDCDGRVFAHSSEYPGLSLAYMIGRHNVTTFQVPARGYATLADVRFLIDAHKRVDFQGRPVRIWDPEPRVVEGSVMQGSYRSAGGDVAESRLYWEATWDVHRRLVVDARIKVADDDWRPLGGDRAEEAIVEGRIDSPPGIEGRFRFFLEEVSREPGIAINKEDPEGDGRLDLEFVDGQEGFDAPEANGADGWKLEGTASESEVSVEILPNDYGAWAKVRCVVVIEGEEYDCRSENDAAYVTLPVDDDENHVADAWEDEMEVGGAAEADEDSEPEGREAGDGLSMYEEYRGAFSEGQWLDFDPKEKDLFVHNAIGSNAGVLDGLTLFEEASGLLVHWIDEDEYEGPDTRVLNFKRGSYAARPDGQKGLRLIDGALEGAFGEMFPTGAGWMPSPPNRVLEVVIDVVSADGNAGLLASTVAHELGHAVNLWHPGRFDQIDCFNDGYYKDVAPQSGVASGPMANIMRYSYWNVGWYQARDGVCHGYPSYDNGFGSTFAASLAGDGLNGGAARTDEDGDPLPLTGDAGCAGTQRSNLSVAGDSAALPGSLCW